MLQDLVWIGLTLKRETHNSHQEAGVRHAFAQHFRLRANTLRVETGCWQIHNRLCDKCDLHDVQDEKHVLFLSPCLEMCYLRRRFKEQFADCTDRTYIGDTGAFYFNNIGAEDVKSFLLKPPTNDLLPRLMVEVCLVLAPDVNFFLNSR